MLVKKRIGLIAGSFCIPISLAIFSCIDCGPFHDKYKMKGFEWFNYQATYSDSTAQKLIVTELGDSVEYRLYSIYIRPIQEYYFSQNSMIRDFDLISSAYACDPVPPNTDEIIDSIKITSGKDFDVSHPAGTDLSDIFDIVVLDEANYIYYKRFQLQEYLLTNPEVPAIMALFLRTPPATTDEFSFEVKYYQDGIDIDFLKFVTDAVVIERE